MSQLNSNMNFLPEDYVEKRKATRAAVVFIGLLVIVVGGILGAYVFKQMQSKDVFEEQTKVNADYDEASRQITVAQDLEKEKARMMAKAELTTTLMERVRRSSLLEELSRLCPKGVKMQTLDLTSKDGQNAPKPLNDLERARRAQAGLPAEQASTPQKDVLIDLVGTAPTDKEVAEYIASLSKSDLLRDVNLSFSEEYSKDRSENAEKVRRFRVQMKVNPSADLRGLDGSAAPVASK